MAARRDLLLEEIEKLEATEFHVASNQGTYGPREACKRVGCGDPTIANRDVYETVAGLVRATGPDEARAPGRMRALNRSRLAEAKRKLASLKAELARLPKK